MRIKYYARDKETKKSRIYNNEKIFLELFTDQQNDLDLERYEIGKHFTVIYKYNNDKWNYKEVKDR